jgi:hypothetical protein
VEPEVAQVVAEINLRKQHKYRMGWSKADQRDENQWTIHDDQLHEKLIGLRYAECWICHPELD